MDHKNYNLMDHNDQEIYYLCKRCSNSLSL